MLVLLFTSLIELLLRPIKNKAGFAGVPCELLNPVQTEDGILIPHAGQYMT